jgi:hypothetical protein
MVLRMSRTNSTMLFSLISTTCSTRRIALEYLARDRLADRACPADNQEARTAYLAAQMRIQIANIAVEQVAFTPN